jgi:hypothetical protein
MPLVWKNDCFQKQNEHTGRVAVKKWMKIGLSSLIGLSLIAMAVDAWAADEIKPGIQKVK